VTGEPPAGPGGTLRVSRTHALSRSDLRRLLPRLVLPVALCEEGDRLVADYPDGRRLTVELGAETERRLGSLRLRDTAFTFVFEGWSGAEVRAFMVLCTQRLQQGGG
jgi:hypothetical protein